MTSHFGNNQDFQSQPAINQEKATMTTQRPLRRPAVASFWVGVVLAWSPAAVDAAVIVDDHFDNGVLGTNTTGIGSGFTAQYVAPVESGATVTLTGGSGWNNSGMISKDAAGIFDADGGTVTFVLAGATGSQTQAQVGVGDAAYGSYSDFMTSSSQTFGKPVGFALAMGGSNGFGTTQWTLHADSAQYRLSDGYPSYSYATVLSQFASTWDGTTPLTVTMELSLAGWAVSFSNGMPTQAGLWSSVTWPTAVGDLGTYSPLMTVLDVADMRAKVRVQGAQFDTRTLTIDRMVVDNAIVVIPEPASLGLLALGGLALLRRRRE